MNRAYTNVLRVLETANGPIPGAILPNGHNIPGATRQTLINMRDEGLVEFRYGLFGGGAGYTITEKGREALKEEDQ